MFFGRKVFREFPQVVQNLEKLQKPSEKNSAALAPEFTLYHKRDKGGLESSFRHYYIHPWDEGPPKTGAASECGKPVVGKRDRRCAHQAHTQQISPPMAVLSTKRNPVHFTHRRVAAKPGQSVNSSGNTSIRTSPLVSEEKNMSRQPQPGLNEPKRRPQPPAVGDKLPPDPPFRRTDRQCGRRPPQSGPVVTEVPTRH